MRKPLNHLLLALFAFFSFYPLLSNAQSKPLKSSIFWEISGKNLEKPSYLFGTFHLLNENYLNKHNQWKVFFNKSEAVMVEMVLDSTKMKDLIGQMISPDTTLDQLLSDSEYQATNEYFKEVSGSNLESYNTLKPISLTFILTSYTWAKLRPEEYIRNDLPMDLFFVKEGKDRAKKIIPLETMEEQMHLLYDGTSLKRQKEILMDMVNNKAKTKENILEMDNCYRKQDLNCLQDLIYNSESYNKEELDKLLKNRNVKWMEKIKDAIHTKSTFIAVGAGHLSGNEGLINLLKEEGYTVKPIEF